MDKIENNGENRNAASTSFVTDHQSLSESSDQSGTVNRLIGMLLSPHATFEDINRRPNWLAPMIIAVGIVVICNLLLVWRVNLNWQQLALNQIAKIEMQTGQQDSPEQVAKKIAYTTMLGRFFVVLPILTIPLTYILLAVVFAFTFGILQEQPPFKKILSVVAWSAATKIALAAIPFIGVLLLRDKESFEGADPTQLNLVISNLDVILSPNTYAPIKSIVRSLDIFTIWFLILLSLGFAAISESRRVTAMKSGLMVLGLWIMWTIFKAALAGLLST